MLLNHSMIQIFLKMSIKIEEDCQVQIKYKKNVRGRKESDKIFREVERERDRIR